MERLFTFVPAEGPLTIYGYLRIGTVHLDQYQVHLRGYRHYGGLTELDVPHNPCLGVPVDLPPLEIESWSAWKTLLASTPGEINFGEGFEDAVLSLDEFIKLVEERASPRTLGRDGKPLSSPYEYIRNSQKERHLKQMENPNLHWKDEEGYSFTTLWHF
jgi:hypothetical protein